MDVQLINIEITNTKRLPGHKKGSNMTLYCQHFAAIVFFHLDKWFSYPGFGPSWIVCFPDDLLAVS